jgi:hypothetical protein
MTVPASWETIISERWDDAEVTAATENAVMSSHQTESGVCIVRVEVQPGHLLIKVTSDRSLGRNLYPASSDPPRHFTDPDDALQAVADFLCSFRQAKQD